MAPSSSSRGVLAPSSPPRQAQVKACSAVVGPSRLAHEAKAGVRALQEALPAQRRAQSAFLARSSKIQRGHARAQAQARQAETSAAARPRTNDDLEARPSARPSVLLPGRHGHEQEQDNDQEQDRDERMRVLHRLEPGPGSLDEAPEWDRDWERFEPVSRTRLRRRLVPHETLLGFVDGRFLLPPPLLYSVCTPGTRDGDFDVPVDGDWLTICVLAEKGPLRETRDTSRPDSSEHEREHREEAPPRQRRYMTAKLVDLATGTDSARGDAELLMTVFEAERTWRDADGKRHYSGGSGGAFERLQIEQPGAVLCLLNPKVRRGGRDRYSAAAGAPSAGAGARARAAAYGDDGDGSRLMCLNPTAASSLVVVGYAADHGECEAIKQDGTRCARFVDRRTGAHACAFHVANALERTKNGRQELANSASTSFRPAARDGSSHGLFGLSDGMGLNGGGRTATFVSHHRGPLPSARDPRSSAFDVAGSFGRDRQRREATRKREQQLDQLTSSLAPTTARKRPRLDLSDVGLEDQHRANSVGGKALLDAQHLVSCGNSTCPPPTQDGAAAPKKRTFAYGAETIKKIGFDPFQSAVTPSQQRRTPSSAPSAHPSGASSRVSLCSCISPETCD